MTCVVLADGRFDRQIISRFMPCLEQYEAVDIDPKALNNLNEMYSTSKYKVKYNTLCNTMPPHNKLAQMVQAEY